MHFVAVIKKMPLPPSIPGDPEKCHELNDNQLYEFKKLLTNALYDRLVERLGYLFLMLQGHLEPLLPSEKARFQELADCEFQVSHVE